MTITNSCKGVWIIDDVYKKISLSCWVTYNTANDPGQLWVWGSNYQGQLGIGLTQAQCGSVSSPVQIPGSEWIETSSGLTVLGRKIDGTLWGWGENVLGSIGVNDIVKRSSPVQVPGTQWSCIGNNGGHASFGLKTDGTLWAWGSNGYGSLGNNCVTGNVSSPVQIPGTQWCSMGTGSYANVGLKTDGTLWVWGRNTRGAAGQNDTTVNAYSSPIQVPGTQWISAVTGASAGSVLARKTDGTLWSWGYNYNGQLGLGCAGPGGPTSSPVQVPGTQWTQVCTGGYLRAHTLARKSDGTLWSWGYNRRGQLGISNCAGGYLPLNSPMQIPGTAWTDIAINCQASAAIKSDGTLWTWGQNRCGALGNNSYSFTGISSPAQIPGTQWADIARGRGIFTAIKK